MPRQEPPRPRLGMQRRESWWQGLADEGCEGMARPGVVGRTTQRAQPRRGSSSRGRCGHWPFAPCPGLAGPSPPLLPPPHTSGRHGQ